MPHSPRELMVEHRLLWECFQRVRVHNRRKSKVMVQCLNCPHCLSFALFEHLIYIWLIRLEVINAYKLTAYVRVGYQRFDTKL